MRVHGAGAMQVRSVHNAGIHGMHVCMCMCPKGVRCMSVGENARLTEGIEVECPWVRVRVS